MKLDDAQLIRMIRRMPNILLFSIATIESKVRFLFDHLDNEEEARDLLVKNPSLITYSLANRYIPRLEEAMAEGVVINRSWLLRMGVSPEKKWIQYLKDHKKRMTEEELKDGWV